MNLTVISPLNQFHFAKDNDLQRLLLRPWEDKKKGMYIQKVARGKLFRFAFSATSNSSHSLKVIRYTGNTYKEVLTITQTTTADIAGNLTLTGDQLHTYVYKLANLSALTADGYYALKLFVDYNGTDTETFVSEPFYLKNSHPGCAEVTWWHSTNKGMEDMYFETLPTRFTMLVEGILEPQIPGSEDVVYQDQGEDAVLLDSKVYEVLKFRTGGNGVGIPDWMLSKLTYILTCDTVLIKDELSTSAKRVVKAGGGKWEQVKDAGNPLHGDSIDLWLADNSSTFTHGIRKVSLFTVPSYPFAVYDIRIGKGSANISIMPLAAAVVDDSGELATLITSLNTNAANADLFGTIANNSGVVQYTCAVGEDYDVAYAPIYTTFFGFQFQSSGALTRSFSLTASRAVVDWGSGSPARVGYLPFVPITVSKTYPAGIAAYDIRVFGPMEEFSMVGQANIGFWTGTVPAGLKKFTLDTFSFTASTLDFAMFAPAALSLTNITVRNAGLSAANNFNSVYIPRLKDIDFSNNQFNQTVVSAFMYDVWRNASNNGAGPSLPGGTFSITSQSPAVTSLNGTGVLYYNRLKASPLFWRPSF
jgi:hypothetical protein